MTVAAVILAATPDSALEDAGGRPTARRVVESAWAGGAVPIVVVAPERDGAVAVSLAGSPATLVPPAALEGGPVAQIVRGISVAASEVSDTDAVLIWPARIVWADPETVTSLIEAHGVDAQPILRPAYEGRNGWPVLVPLVHLAALAGLAPDRMPDQLLADLEASGVRVRGIELGDPGVVHDRTTAIDDLPRYEGPPQPAGGPPPEWGLDSMDAPDDAPLEGPSLAPYAPAEADTD